MQALLVGPLRPWAPQAQEELLKGATCSKDTLNVERHVLELVGPVVGERKGLAGAPVLQRKGPGTWWAAVQGAKEDPELLVGIKPEPGLS